ncbi:MAG TPA: deoxyuridine 5'-triphosphate nucleotidohydrolase [Methanofastidiosum sp.]|nr:deoxyuridine 5'-triphosphate nucleotidohydrolase [Methanofastidiosum sp.]HPA49839.1 deoxyuridine 5'-triphosphate nucleotidohydrolase [Methanofastidiosum sp.]HQK63173.1 deoxyuridine 5'-triphosphate nucleotidohydrolase [Methanofastidiosum sp.]HQM95271.1 deoxyuridine 5'-triphosphate nucleotidohydrolase [Methanofastidiosum sp.]HQQ48975.1 deoxyuridine 5'-triphosphate nucleotidohydrolase [Methanofastidiosum sp.]
MDNCVLTGNQIRELISKRGLIQNYIDLDTQVTPNGFDMTVREVHRIISEGTIDFSNEKRKLSETEKIEFVDNSIFLEKGSYKILYNEIVNIPPDIMALGRPRSTLLRCGANVGTAVWDRGYNGRSESLLTVENIKGIKVYKDARVLQLVFFRTLTDEDLYKGIFLNENI